MKMMQEEHEFRVIINEKVRVAKEQTENEFEDVIDYFIKRGWLKSAIKEWVLTKTLERLLSQEGEKARVRK